MSIQLNLEILNLNHSIDVAQDWGIQAKTCKLSEIFKQPYRIACVPAFFNHENNFAYQADMSRINLGLFDLVIISDIEQEYTRDLQTWIENNRIKNYVLAQGAHHESQGINQATTVVRSWWMQNLLRLNSYQPTHAPKKTFWFDALLGARRPHRDFVMLSMQKHPRLLASSLVTYRDVFNTGAIVDEQTQLVHDYFPGLDLAWPYVSDNLDNNWETATQIDKSHSAYVPWNIYKHTWYSAICETAFTGDGFFLTEKTTKALFAKRLFVLFGPCHFLKQLRDFGFETFGSVIDEDYDHELVDLVRYRKAFAQMLSLVQQDPRKVYDKIEPVLRHNAHRLVTWQQEIAMRQQELLLDRIPAQYVTVTV